MQDKDFELYWGHLWSDDEDICGMVEDGLEDDLIRYLMEERRFSERKAILYLENVRANLKSPSSHREIGPSCILLSIGGFLLFMGVYFSHMWIQEYLISYGSENWTQIKGTMLDKSVELGTSSSSSSGSNSLTYFSAQGTYEFVYGESKITGKRLDFNNSSTGDLEAVEKFLASLPEPGEDVIVYYDEKSHNSVLIPGSQSVPKGPIIPILLFLLIGARLVRAAFK
jgi:hypothetical protein